MRQHFFGRVVAGGVLMIQAARASEIRNAALGGHTGATEKHDIVRTCQKRLESIGVQFLHLLFGRL
jgi:hypothetical protein